MSPCSRDHIFILQDRSPIRMSGVWSLRILANKLLSRAFPADCPHRVDFHFPVINDGMSTSGYSEFPAYSQMLTSLLPVRRAAIIYLRHCCYSLTEAKGLDRFLFRPTLHVAMEIGPYLHPGYRVFGVWPLRILSSMGSIGCFRHFPFEFIE